MQKGPGPSQPCGRTLTLSLEVAAAGGGSFGKSASCTWAPPEAASSSAIIRTWVRPGHQQAGQSLVPSASPQIHLVTASSMATLRPCPTPLPTVTRSFGARVFSRTTESQGTQLPRPCSPVTYPPLGEVPERLRATTHIPDCRLHEVSLDFLSFLFGAHGG